MALYVGTNYHPHDWQPERWEKDIALMKEAGFQVVRLGHLCWDSYEPEDGRYTFEWFDTVMDLFYEAGIRVFLDVSMRPAPVWVHRLCPGCDIAAPNGIPQESVRRYMEDVDDPEYQYYALRFARVLVRRYKGHPALMGFGLCNELGDGPISYSEAAEKRFRAWVKEKYQTVDRLNRAWNTQRWSRRLTSFEDVVLPENELAKGAPEPYLDMRRFFGDGVARFMRKLHQVILEEAPDIAQSSNHVAESDYLGFDYLRYCDSMIEYPGIGFYPGLDADNKEILIEVFSLVQQRLAELGKPMWCLEFQTGSFGNYAAGDGVIRMYALLNLALRSQMILAWTWRSMLGGEEQYCYGLLDHDGECGRKYREFARIAADFKKLEKYSFPYLPTPEIALAYCYENVPICQYSPFQYRFRYKRQYRDAYRVFYERNLDCNSVDLREIKMDYKLLLIPAHPIMTEQMAENVRNFVKEGGIVIMTGYSAKVDETNTVFDTALPGRLADVFGIRVGAFSRSHLLPVNPPENAPKKRFQVKTEDGDTAAYDAAYWETIELRGAEAYAVYTEGEEGCAVSCNRYGKGKAYYTAAETNTDLLGWLYDRIAGQEQRKNAPPVPDGVVARKLSEREFFYVNTTGEPKEIVLPKPGRGVLREKKLEGRFLLEPYDGELVVEGEGEGSDE